MLIPVAIGMFQHLPFLETLNEFRVTPFKAKTKPRLTGRGY